MSLQTPRRATEQVVLWMIRRPWWVACALVTLLIGLQPVGIARIDTLICEVLVDAALPVNLVHEDVPAAGLWLQLASALLPLALVGVLTRRNPQEWRGRWVLALGLLPIGLAVVGLSLLGRWIAPASAILGWCLGYWLWRAGHLRDTRVELLKTRGQANATLRAITDAVFTVDDEHRVQLMNPVAEQLAQPLGHPQPQQPLQPPRITDLLLLDARDEGRLDDAIDACLRQGRVIQVPQPVALMRQGHDRLLRVTASPIFERHDSKPGGSQAERAVVVLSDMTDIVRTSARLLHEASHDPLTGLLNRVTLADHFVLALGQARQAGRQLALLFIDLDRFKRINDSLGHRHGDAVLKIVAHRLREQVVAASSDLFLARWGGDEFVVLMEDGTDGLAAHAMASQLIEAVSRDIDLDDLDVQCSCSVGVALAPGQADTLDALLTLADAGMRRAKLHGGSRAEFSMPHPAGVPATAPWTRDVLTLEARLRRALHGGELELFYQPQLDVVSGEPVGLEALLRWHQGNGVMWTPSQFLDVAEESGLILDIGAWAIREATRQLAKWRALDMPLIPVSINVSARQCLDRRLVQVVSQALTADQIPASLLKLEITETTAMTDVEQVMHLLAELRELGVGVAVDDFGTGYSSLAHLQRLPIDQIKIDQSFVRDIANDRHGAAIVRATIALAHELGVPVVAEGVEHQSQLSFLTLHRCDIAQGYFFARPLSGADTGTYLRDSRNGPPRAVGNA